MKNIWWLGMLCLGLAAMLFASAVRAEEKDDGKDEEEIALDKVPEAVMKAAKEAVKDLAVTKAEKETKGGKTIYEIKGKAGDKFYEIELSAEGKVLSKKELSKEEQAKEEKEEQEEAKEKK